MDLQYERKVQINEWIITTRWFYMVAIFLIGILSNSIISVFAVKFSFITVAILLLVFIYINAYFYYTLNEIKKTRSLKRLRLLSFFQIAIELAVFAIILQVGGDKGITSVFFFLPIISASVIFGTRGAVLTALISAALVNIAVVSEYFYYVLYNVIDRGVFNQSEFGQLKYMTLDLIKVLVTSNLYFVIAVFMGYGSKLLFRREQKLMAQAEKLTLEKKMREKEVENLDKHARILAKKDAELVVINNQLNKKIEELEKSEKSLIRAFTDLQEARKKAEEERNKTAAIISNFIDPIILIDKNSRINLFNPAAEEVFGFIVSDLGKKVGHADNYSMENFKEIITQDFIVKSNKDLKSMSAEEEEVVIRQGTQELTYKVITAKVVDNRNEYLGVMKIFYNLTREKMIDQMKSDFISIAAHQLRTPLSAIKWVIKMVLDGDAGKLNEEQQKLLFKGYQSNERIIDLVNDMLNVSRIEEGRFGYDFTTSDFGEVIDIAVENLENLIKSKNIKFSIIKPKKLPEIHMDKQKMYLVVQNLLENAIKYTPEYGKVKLSVEPGDKFLTVRVSDNGVGIPEKEKSKLFTKFFRADNVVRMQTEGSGLGLFIVKNVIKKHGGEIHVESEEGVGSTFSFTLPIN